MSTYATEQDVQDYIEGGSTLDQFALERYIQRAEGDIDLLVFRTRTELPPTQVISLGSPSDLPTGGNATLTFNGQTTAQLNWPITAQQIEAALAALSGIGTDSNSVPNAQVFGSNPFTVIWTVDWVKLNFVGRTPPLVVGGQDEYPVDFNIPLIVVNNSLTGASNPPPVAVKQVRGRKVNPLTDIDQNQVLALSRATCAQVEYRIIMGERFFVRPQYSSVRGPDFQTSGKLPWLAPKAQRELAQVGLFRTGGRAFAGWGRRGVAKGWPTY